MSNENLQNHQEEINLKEILDIILDKKLLISSITLIAAVLSVIYSLSLPNIYSSNALIAPTSNDTSMNTKLGAFSSIAGMVGMDMPSQSGDKSAEAIERINSYDFFIDEFLPNIKFANLVAAKSWDKSTNTVLYNKSIFDPNIKKPTNQEAFEIYKSILNITQDSRTSFVVLKIEHVSPFIAQKWLELIITQINNYMRELDKTVAKNSIEFLNISALETNLSGTKEAIFNLMENQIQVLTLAEATNDYVFKRISSPIAPERKSKPSRASICISGTIFGFIFSIFLSLFLHYFRRVIQKFS